MKCFERAIIGGKADVFEWLFQQDNHSIRFHPNNVNNLFHLACNNGQVEVAKMMIESGADVNSLYFNGRRALYNLHMSK